MLEPIKNIPLSSVIKIISGHKILSTPDKDESFNKLVHLLKKSIIAAGGDINKGGLKIKRVNEVGNKIEEFVRNSMNRLNMNAEIPVTASGKRKSTGYPDIEFSYNGSKHYLECKTFNKDTVDTTFRSFYLSPSKDSKITHDAYHFVASFEIYAHRRTGGVTVYKCRGWKLLSVENLPVDVKYEFQSDNKRLYDKNRLIEEGKFKKLLKNKRLKK